jgi:hypothetical protein
MAEIDGPLLAEDQYGAESAPLIKIQENARRGIG